MFGLKARKSKDLLLAFILKKHERPVYDFSFEKAAKLSFCFQFGGGTPLKLIFKTFCS